MVNRDAVGLIVSRHFAEVEFTRPSFPKPDDWGPISLDVDVPEEIVNEYRVLIGQRKFDWNDFWRDIGPPLRANYDSAHRGWNDSDATRYVLGVLINARKVQVDARREDDRVNLSIEELL